MEEMWKKIEEEILNIKKEELKLKELTAKSDKVKEEKEKRQKELGEITDPSSGFYQDAKAKVDEKEQQFIEVNNERMKKDTELKGLIQLKKDEIRKELADKKRNIDENRNVDLKDKDLGKLKAEREQINKELELNNVTREEFEQKSDSEKKEIRRAKERYLINKNRLTEIEPDIQLLENLDNKTPKEAYMALDHLDKLVETNFNQANLMVLLEQSSLLNDMVEGREKREEQRYEENVKVSLKETVERIQKERQEEEQRRKEEEQEWQQWIKEGPAGENPPPHSGTGENPPPHSGIGENPPPHSGAGQNPPPPPGQNSILGSRLGPEQKPQTVDPDLPCRVTTILISEQKNKRGRVLWINERGEEDKRMVSEAFETARAKYKRLNIFEQCKGITGNPLRAFLLKRQLNPEIVLALDDYKYRGQLKEYISSIYNKTKLPFELKHDLTEGSIFTKIKMNGFAKVEKELGANVLGKLKWFNKNKTLPPAKTESQAEEEKARIRQSLKETLREENSDNHIEKIANKKMQETQEIIAKEIQDSRNKIEKVSGSVEDKEGNIIKEDDSMSL